MVTAAYTVELMWEEQAWLCRGFEELTANIGHAVTGTFAPPKERTLCAQQTYPSAACT
jgi:hypothetical protein